MKKSILREYARLIARSGVNIQPVRRCSHRPSWTSRSS